MNEEEGFPLQMVVTQTSIVPDDPGEKTVFTCHSSLKFSFTNCAIYRFDRESNRRLD